MNSIAIVSPCPVLNRPDFRFVFGGIDGTTLIQDSLGHPIHYEFVALPGTDFSVEETLFLGDHEIYSVRSDSYPQRPLYIDSRFAAPAPSLALAQKALPPRSVLIQRMKALTGTPYVWGGNWSQGIPQMLDYYPPKGSLDNRTKTLWTFSGVDCSGLLYEASLGASPRNTSALIRCGQGLPIAGKSEREILGILEPMDVVVWPGHVWFVLDERRSIESKFPFGVICRPLLKRLAETCSQRRAVDDWTDGVDPQTSFTIRRLSPHL